MGGGRAGGGTASRACVGAGSRRCTGTPHPLLRAPTCSPAHPPQLAALIAQTLLSKLLPFVPRPAFFSINSTPASYASILERSRREMAALKAALAAAAVAAAAAAWRAWGRAAMAALGLA